MAHVDCSKLAKGLRLEGKVPKDVGHEVVPVGSSEGHSVNRLAICKGRIYTKGKESEWLGTEETAL